MIYIYDTVLQKGQDHLKRYGVNYKLTNRNRMGDFIFYNFEYPGRETILVVPHFAEEYREVERKLAKFPEGKELESYLRLIRKNFGSNFVTDEYVNNNSSTGKSTVIFLETGDIKITLEYYNNSIHLSEDFEIVKNYIFGDGIVVQMNVNMEGDI